MEHWPLNQEAHRFGLTNADECIDFEVYRNDQRWVEVAEEECRRLDAVVRTLKPARHNATVQGRRSVRDTAELYVVGRSACGIELALSRKLDSCPRPCSRRCSFGMQQYYWRDLNVVLEEVAEVEGVDLVLVQVVAIAVRRVSEISSVLFNCGALTFSSLGPL